MVDRINRPYGSYDMTQADAIAIAAREIGKRRGVTIVRNDKKLEHLYQEAKYHCVLDVPEYCEALSSSSTADYTRKVLESFAVADARKHGANYTHIKHTIHPVYHNRTIVSLTAAHYAIIGDAEHTFVHDCMYKDVSDELRAALETLCIKHCADEYAAYTHPRMGSKSPDVGDAISFSFKNKRKQIRSRVIPHQFDTDIGPYHLFEPGAAYISRSDYTDWWCSKPMGSVYSLEDYQLIAFVNDIGMYLPQEEQNVLVNERLFARSPWSFKSESHLIRFYNEGDVDQFKHYFPLTKGSHRAEAAKSIMEGEVRNEALDLFLFNHGYREFPVKYLDLYHTSVDGFLHYFENASLEHRQEIIRDITDPEIISEPSEHEAEIAQGLSALYPEFERLLMQSVS